MPNFAGTWKMRSSENFDELLKVLGVNAMLRKVAVAAASKPLVEIRQDGDQFYIKTSTTVRTTEINFKIGEEFEEETVDGRKCKDNKLDFLHYGFLILRGFCFVGHKEILQQINKVNQPINESLPNWENENKIYCKQTLLSGSGPKTHWTRELVNDELILTLVANDVVCTRVYVKE